MTIDQSLREDLRKLLVGRQVHVQSEETLTGLPFDLQGARPAGAEHTPWQVLEHLRIAQWDILEFCRDPGHVSPSVPKGHWPETSTPPHESAWRESYASFKRDLLEMVDLVSDPGQDLLASLAHGTGQTLLREALLIADHNAYHLGEMVLLRRMLGCWEPDAVILAMVEASGSLIQGASEASENALSVDERLLVVKKAFLINDLPERKIYDQMERKLLKWGRWELVNQKEDADALLFLYQMNIPVHSDKRVLTVVDPRIGDRLLIVSCKVRITAGLNADVLFGKLQKWIRKIEEGWRKQGNQ